jgi:hypothetical protein
MSELIVDSKAFAEVAESRRNSARLMTVSTLYFNLTKTAAALTVAAGAVCCRDARLCRNAGAGRVGEPQAGRGRAREPN